MTVMHVSTPTLSDSRSDNSLSFSGSRHGRRGVDVSKYRTQMCYNYKYGTHCAFGARCAFSHAEQPGAPMRGHVSRLSEADHAPPPPPYTVAIRNGMGLPPAYASRFRHDPYSFQGVMMED
uniref:Putative zinc finger protein ZFP1 n=1 Tax=Trypanosoma congolense (strain IL3000) TaxID=1068625 RepID=G0UNU6_TRYCI|nr:putative zinc finger protein ZFP1 [Trypanosoma congolense IL3000]